MSFDCNAELENWLLNLLSEFRLPPKYLFAEKSAFEEQLNRPHIGATLHEIESCLSKLIEQSFVEWTADVHGTKLSRPFTSTSLGLTPVGGGVWLTRNKRSVYDLIDIEYPANEDSLSPVLQLAGVRNDELLPLVELLNEVGFVKTYEAIEVSSFFLRYWYCVTEARSFRIVGNYSWQQFRTTEENAYKNLVRFAY